MGKQSKIAKRCHASFAGLERCLQRYLLYLHAEFSEPVETRAAGVGNKKA